MRETGGFKLASTVTLVLQANQLTKCPTSNPEGSIQSKTKANAFHPSSPARLPIDDIYSVYLRGFIIWNKTLILVETSRAVPEFKNNIKQIGHVDCGCMICRGYKMI